MPANETLACVDSDVPEHQMSAWAGGGFSLTAVTFPNGVTVDVEVEGVAGRLVLVRSLTAKEVRVADEQAARVRTVATTSATPSRG